MGAGWLAFGKAWGAIGEFEWRRKCGGILGSIFAFSADQLERAVGEFSEKGAGFDDTVERLTEELAIDANF